MDKRLRQLLFRGYCLADWARKDWEEQGNITRGQIFVVKDLRAITGMWASWETLGQLLFFFLLVNLAFTISQDWQIYSKYTFFVAYYRYPHVSRSELIHEQSLLVARVTWLMNYAVYLGLMIPWKISQDRPEQPQRFTDEHIIIIIIIIIITFVDE